MDAKALIDSTVPLLVNEKNTVSISQGSSNYSELYSFILNFKTNYLLEIFMDIWSKGVKCMLIN